MAQVEKNGKGTMKTALIIHGTCDQEEYFSDTYPSLSNSHWLPWLQKQMLIAGFETETPEMPVAYLPRYSEWKRTIERYRISDESILVGHSCGGGFLLRWLSENHLTPKRVVLVAPWLDPSREKDPEFFQFTINSNLTSRTELHVVVSDNDTSDINSSVKAIQSALPGAHTHFFPNLGHFCFSDMATEKFLELREIVLRK
jgi:hypothetical protein